MCCEIIKKKSCGQCWDPYIQFIVIGGTGEVKDKLALLFCFGGLDWIFKDLRLSGYSFFKFEVPSLT